MFVQSSKKKLQIKAFFSYLIHSFNELFYGYLRIPKVKANNFL